MPRSKPPKPLTLILPPPSQYTNPSTTSSPPTLEVLLLAQQIASKRGQVFDVEAFIAPDQKEEYYRRIHRTPRQLNKGESSPTSIPAPLPSTTADLSVVVTEPDPEITVETESIPPTPLPHDAPTPNADPTSTSTPSSPTKRVKPPLPNLAHLHWKKRLKILNQIEAGIPISEGELLPPTPLPDGLRGKGLTGKDKEGIQGSASYWCVWVSSSILSSPGNITYSHHLHCTRQPLRRWLIRQELPLDPSSKIQRSSMGLQHSTLPPRSRL